MRACLGSLSVGSEKTKKPRGSEAAACKVRGQWGLRGGNGETRIACGRRGNLESPQGRKERREGRAGVARERGAHSLQKTYSVQLVQILSSLWSVLPAKAQVPGTARHHVEARLGQLVGACSEAEFEAARGGKAWGRSGSRLVQGVLEHSLASDVPALHTRCATG